VTTAQWVRLAVEIVVDLVTGRLEGPGKASTPPVGLPHKHSELQAKASREAGRHGVVTGKPRRDPSR
jgi:hypothetical protein